MLGITKYAQRLLDDLTRLDYIERVKIQQRNWIGRSTGAEVDFDTTAGDKLTVFTTRPDTLFGATYMVIAPEHEILNKWQDKLTNLDAVKAYQTAAAKNSDWRRTELAKDKTASSRRVRAINPSERHRDTDLYLRLRPCHLRQPGAIMAVPGHDTRDWSFAKEFGLPIIEVVQGGDVEKEAFTDCETGVMVNSGFLNGLPVEEAIPTIIRWLTDKGIGHEKVNFKLRDWVFSRQRYWGEPIPIINCPKCGWVPMDEKDLPLLLPDVKSYEPTDNGESPLAHMRDWVECTCPRCGGPAEHETDTMPQWAGSSWYFLRYADPHNTEALASKEALDYWTPVDWYNGGMEHTTLHLLYSRFWHKFLYDIGVVPTKEPYMKRTSHGMILGLNPHNFENLSDSEKTQLLNEYGSEKAVKKYLVEKYGEMATHPIVKMSKSLGNVVNPDDVIKEYGADTLRLYVMFLGDFEKAAPWSNTAVKGCKRFLDRVWNLAEKKLDGNDSYSQTHEALVHRTIKKVGEDIESMKFNTAIAALMAMVNEYYDKKPSRGDIKALLTLLSPFAPHIVEELWEIQGFGGYACLTEWPSYDEAKMVEKEKEIAVQVNGKLKTTVVVPMDADDDTVYGIVIQNFKIAKAMEGMQVVRKIFVKNKLVNLILKPENK